MKLKVAILMFIVLAVSAQGWTKFFNWQGSQQQVRCDSNRITMNSFNNPMVDGEEYFLQDSYNTENNIHVTQYVALIKNWDKKKKYYSIQVNTLRNYADRTDDEDGNGYMTIFTLVLTNASNNDSFKTSYTVWYKPKGTWDTQTIKRMENID